jgi:hypothetical protein
VARPHPALIDLAAGRTLPDSVADPERLTASAVEHRMGGLLLSASERGLINLPDRETQILVDQDLEHWARNLLLLEQAVDISRRLAEVGVRTVVLKGVANEVRWFERTGLRPCFDIDLLLVPCSPSLLQGAIEALAPAHPLADSLPALVASSRVQSADFLHLGIPIDLHTDFLKLEILSTRHPETVADHTMLLSTPAGELTVLDPEFSLIVAVIHLNKDRFRYLLGFAEIARILNRESIDWEAIYRFLDGEGLSESFASALGVVVDTLRLDFDFPRPTRAWLRSAPWRALWPPGVRLLGDLGRIKYRKRQLALALMARGRFWSALRGWGARLFPPAPLVDYFYPDVPGGYWGKLLVGRVRKRYHDLSSRRKMAGTTR